jgi:hypothetical protein
VNRLTAPGTNNVDLARIGVGQEGGGQIVEEHLRVRQLVGQTSGGVLRVIRQARPIDGQETSRRDRPYARSGGGERAADGVEGEQRAVFLRGEFPADRDGGVWQRTAARVDGYGDLRIDLQRLPSALPGSVAERSQGDIVFAVIEVRPDSACDQGVLAVVRDIDAESDRPICGC